MSTVIESTSCSTFFRLKIIHCGWLNERYTLVILIPCTMLDEYRSQASFNVERMRLIFEDESTQAYRVRDLRSKFIIISLVVFF